MVAAESILRFGSESERERAIVYLFDWAVWSVNDVFTTMTALTALESLGPEIIKYSEQIERMSAGGESPDGRYDSYVPRLVANLREQLKKAK
jgi:hypothetical protein